MVGNDNYNPDCDATGSQVQPMYFDHSIVIYLLILLYL